jgi:hypothetical protein
MLPRRGRGHHVRVTTRDQLGRTLTSNQDQLLNPPGIDLCKAIVGRTRLHGGDQVGSCVRTAGGKPPPVPGGFPNDWTDLWPEAIDPPAIPQFWTTHAAHRPIRAAPLMDQKHMRSYHGRRRLRYIWPTRHRRERKRPRLRSDGRNHGPARSPHGRHPSSRMSDSPYICSGTCSVRNPRIPRYL